MSDNIIDLNRHKKNKGGEPQEDDLSMESLMESLDSLPENELTDSVGAYVSGRMMKLLGLMDLSGRVSELLTDIGLNPNDFSIDEESTDRYLALDDFDDAGTPFNGPFFDCFTDDAQIRVITAFQEDGEEETVNVVMAVMKLEDGADRWQRYGEDGWVEDGPPADFFDDLDSWDDDWDDDDDDDDDDWDDDDDSLFRQEPWEDEYDESIYSLYLSPQAYRALSRAGIETIERLRQQTDLELLAIDGIGGKELEIIRNAIDEEDFDEEEAGE